ncbi:PREDICTED: solute carrier family 2, facilitated glucose transporter member 3-like [Priapulus caudatus]|uniref:Solute carrier family 2, facilitated glucose transporter member 3-like n=1 Tax=Priapulus caudatus TaxID=37621 RepID=A0ABM1E9S0_PRICU|nr:PREDICTED: solute carrier family 2, facilitated glucose transporter member 3-like [Priapulus caudatus]
MELLDARLLKAGLSWTLIFAVSSMVLGPSFQCGYNLGVINAPQKVFEDFYNKTYYDRTGEPMTDGMLNLLWSFSVAGTAAGGVFGGMSTAFMTDKLGRKPTILLNNILALVSAALFIFSKMLSSFEMIIVGRILIGIHAGLSSGAVPLYIVEISPKHLRGAMGTMHQAAVVISILISQILGLPQLLGNEELWPYLLGVCALPAIYNLLTMGIFLPETPRYLLFAKNDVKKAESALMYLRGKYYSSTELYEIHALAREQKDVPTTNWTYLFREPHLRKPMFISIAIHLAQQLSGVNAVVYYSTSIFITAGLAETSAVYATIGLGTVNMLSTFVSVYLVERLGRSVSAQMGSYVFLIFAGCIALLITYIFFTLPETKGKTIEEISAVFMKAEPQMSGVGEYDNEGFTHYDSRTAKLGTKRRLSMQKSVSQVI